MTTTTKYRKSTTLFEDHGDLEIMVAMMMGVILVILMVVMVVK